MADIELTLGDPRPLNIGEDPWRALGSLPQMSCDLESATRVERDGDRHVAQLSEEWEIWGPNGGYLAAIALRAAGQTAEIAQPRSFYCHFLSSPAFAAVQLEVRALKRGRRAESFSVEMTQEGKPILHALVKTAADGPGYSHRHLTPPEVPPPASLRNYEQLLSSEKPWPFRFWDNVERRPANQEISKAPSAPVIREWTRFRPQACFEDPFLDAARALILLDTFGFPAAHQHHRSWEYLAPNLDTSVWFHDRSPACEWLLIDHQCVAAEHGLLGVSGRVWDTAGKLLATGSAQLCCIENPTGGPPRRRAD